MRSISVRSVIAALFLFGLGAVELQAGAAQDSATNDCKGSAVVTLDRGASVDPRYTSTQTCVGGCSTDVAGQPTNCQGRAAHSSENGDITACACNAGGIAACCGLVIKVGGANTPPPHEGTCQDCTSPAGSHCNSVCTGKVTEGTVTKYTYVAECNNNSSNTGCP